MFTFLSCSNFSVTIFFDNLSILSRGRYINPKMVGQLWTLNPKIFGFGKISTFICFDPGETKCSQMLGHGSELASSSSPPRAPSEAEGPIPTREKLGWRTSSTQPILDSKRLVNSAICCSKRLVNSSSPSSS